MADSRSSAEGPLWQWVEDRIRRVVYRYGYQEIRLPILESAALYSLADAAVPATDAEVMLRPEGTLGCVKAVVDERGSSRQDTRRLWYQGPMFIPGSDGPEQFHQFGVEAFGMQGAELDAELIMLSRDMFSALGLNRRVSLEINTLGTWREQKAASATHLNLESRLHFSTLCHLLDSAGVVYSVNPEIRNGVGYYTRTVFDWTLNENDGVRVSLCSGGRYDELAGRCCGHPLAASGFALDFECLLQRVQQDGSYGSDSAAQIVLRTEDSALGLDAVMLCQRLRRQLPALIVRNDFTTRTVSEPQRETEWVVTLTGPGLAEVWSREDGRGRMVALNQVVNLIAGCVLHAD